LPEAGEASQRPDVVEARPAFVKEQPGLNANRLAFLREDLGPNLNEGDIVIMDGPSIHKVEEL